MNRLKDETSPYLLQHKNNPVNWFPWGEEALGLAKNQDKIIILSIGYSACHWCHVMEHECFEDQEVAAVMNSDFISIKVDREERPDIDNIYMEALQNMGLQGGWPLNVFLLPSGEPFYGGTYFPKQNWLGILRGVKSTFEERREELEKSGRDFAKSLNIKESNRYIFGNISDSVGYTKEELGILADKIKKDFDLQDGGFNRSPKFPMPSVWKMIYHLSNTIEMPILKKHLEFTLDRIVLGGIFDHLAGGWTRYSTDVKWKVPHFEKMLYDNGQLMSLYSQVSSDSDSRELYKWAVDKTYSWLNSEMNQENGGFYSALDADSEGKEGKFYIWTKQEIENILDAEEAIVFVQQYEISESGNWEDGDNILHLEEIQKEWDKFKKSHEKLLEVRNKRIHPGLDNKVITGWNALMVSGLIARSKTFGSDYSLAKEKLDFINTKLSSTYKNKDGASAMGLFHLYGNNNTLGFLDDYAAVIQANIDMYSLCFDESYLHSAESLSKYVLSNFYDAEEGLFYYTDIEGEKLIARKKELFDNVIPASNSAIAQCFYFLGRYLSNAFYVDTAKDMFIKIKPLSLKDPQWLSNWVDLGILLSNKQVEIVVTGNDSLNWIKKIQEIPHLPSTLFFAAKTESTLPVFDQRFFVDKTATFVCEDYACQLPLFSLEDSLQLLNENK